MSQSFESSWNCPVPQVNEDRILMAHGGGGRMMQKLIQEKISKVCPLGQASVHDSAVFIAPSARLAMTTDSYVVHPLFFPGGDIGRLAVYGTINDLAMAGAMPEYLSLSFVLEEGFPMSALDRILESIRDAALEVGASIITGDTKVVERGKGDGVYINTTGIGSVPNEVDIHPHNIELGDVIIVSGDLGRHGVAVMSARHSQDPVQLDILSDCAPLHRVVHALIEAHIQVHCLRDLTRGGLASALHELAEASGLSVCLQEESIPVHRQVAAYCEILGLEPYYLANEGRFICVIPEAEANRTLDLMRTFPLAEQATIIGRFEGAKRSSVRLQSRWGSERILSLLSGEQLPRIC